VHSGSSTCGLSRTNCSKANAKYLVVELNWDGQLVRRCNGLRPRIRKFTSGICGDLPTQADLLGTFDKILKNEPLARRGWELEAW